jgi:signal transduction histidine kinase
LTNAAKHACARRITVELSSTSDAVSLLIADDGRGFDTAEEHSATSSWGLNIMRERAESIGATLRIDSAPGAGTRIIVEVRKMRP